MAAELRITILDTVKLYDAFKFQNLLLKAMLKEKDLMLPIILADLEVNGDINTYDGMYTILKKLYQLNAMHLCGIVSIIVVSSDEHVLALARIMELPIPTITTPTPSSTTPQDAPVPAIQRPVPPAASTSTITPTISSPVKIKTTQANVAAASLLHDVAAATNGKRKRQDDDDDDDDDLDVTEMEPPQKKPRTDLPDLSQMTEAQLNAQKLNTLREVAASVGISKEGNKDEIAFRLRVHYHPDTLSAEMKKLKEELFKLRTKDLKKKYPHVKFVSTTRETMIFQVLGHLMKQGSNNETEEKAASTSKKPAVPSSAPATPTPSIPSSPKVTSTADVIANTKMLAPIASPSKLPSTPNSQNIASHPLLQAKKPSIPATPPSTAAVSSMPSDNTTTPAKIESQIDPSEQVVLTVLGQNNEKIWRKQFRIWKVWQLVYLHLFSILRFKKCTTRLHKC